MSREPGRSTSAILSANISHYYYAALALQEVGYLKRYIYAIGIRRKNLWMSQFLTDYWKKKLRGRDVSGIESKRTHSIWIAELIQRGLPYLHLISPERGNWLNDYLFDILARFKVQSCDIFHFVNSIGLFSARKAKSNGSIIICDVRTVYPDHQVKILEEEYSWLGLPYEQSAKPLSYRKIKAEYTIADYIIVPSQYAKRTFIEAGYSANSIFTVPYGVDQTQFHVSPKHEVPRTAVRGGEECNNTPFRIIYAGRIDPLKGVHYLIEAFSQLAIEDAELLLIGSLDESMAPLISKARSANSNIRTVGMIPKSELYQLYNSGSVFVMPSLVDSWGLVVLEAMACGLPVIVTESTGSSEAVIEGENGFVVPARNTEALQARLSYIYDHPLIREDMRRAALTSASKFTWHSYGRRLIEVYNQILSKNRS